MVRLNHRKSRTGCRQCKARKVKCDEAKPRCKDCARHNLPCEYVYRLSDDAQRQPSANAPIAGPYYDQPQQDGLRVNAPDPTLELRLMHHWTAYTCKTFSTTWEFWCYQAPLKALEFRYLLDAIMSMAALHASKQTPSQWNPIVGRVVPTTDPGDEAAQASSHPTAPWKQAQDKSVMESITNALTNALTESANDANLTTTRGEDMLTASRMYFDRAIDGFRQAVNNVTLENIESVFITSNLVAFNALFSLGLFSVSEGDATSSSPGPDPGLWLRLGRGTYHITQQWRELAGYGWIASSGVFYGEPDLSDEAYIFAVEHGRPFEKLLNFAADFEVFSEEDRIAYASAIAYIGTIYKGVVEGTDSPLATSRRVTAMPSLCSERFVELVESKQPRAMVILAHMFAITKLVDQSAIWLMGIAERQIPKIYEQLPVGWKEMMAWPKAVAQGEIGRKPGELQSNNIAQL